MLYSAGSKGPRLGETHERTNMKRCVSVGPPPPHRLVRADQWRAAAGFVRRMSPHESLLSSLEEAGEERNTTNLRGCLPSPGGERRPPILRCETTTASNICVKFPCFSHFSLFVFVSFSSFFFTIFVWLNVCISLLKKHKHTSC